MYCSKLTQYLPYGNNQLPPPVSLCLTCLSTQYKNAKNCNHKGNKFYRSQVCSTTNKHFLMCTSCNHHVAALQYLSNHHDPKMGYKNYTMMKQCFGDDKYKAMCATVSISVSTATTDSEAKNSASTPTDTVQIWQASSQQRSYIQPYMAVNDTEIGKTAVPSTGQSYVPR